MRNAYKSLLCATVLASSLTGCHGMRLKSVEKAIQYVGKPIAILVDSTTKMSNKLYKNLREEHPNIQGLSMEEHWIDGVEPPENIENQERNP